MAEKRERNPDEGPGRKANPARAREPQEGSNSSAEPPAAGRRSLTGDPDRTSGPAAPDELASPWQEPRGIEKDIADADKVARTGSKDEPVRDTPPAGAWNDTSRD